MWYMSNNLSHIYRYNVDMHTVAQCAFSKLVCLCPVHLLAPTAECSGAT